MMFDLFVSVCQYSHVNEIADGTTCSDPDSLFSVKSTTNKPLQRRNNHFLLWDRGIFSIRDKKEKGELSLSRSKWLSSIIQIVLGYEYLYTVLETF